MARETRPPDYKGDGVVIWENIDTNRKPYLSVKILGGPVVNCWKFELKQKNEGSDNTQG